MMQNKACETQFVLKKKPRSYRRIYLNITNDDAVGKNINVRTQVIPDTVIQAWKGLVVLVFWNLQELINKAHHQVSLLVRE